MVSSTITYTEIVTIGKQNLKQKTKPTFPTITFPRSKFFGESRISTLPIWKESFILLDFTIEKSKKKKQIAECYHEL